MKTWIAKDEVSSEILGNKSLEPTALILLKNNWSNFMSKEESDPF